MEFNLTEELEKYKNQSPEIVFEWKDKLTDAKGWVVINSLRGGAAGGGTRMRKGLTKDEVVSLAKVMEIKFSVCGPSIGGAKSGIDFDPQDPRRIEVLKRWYAAVFPLLKNYYGTGGDLNVDEIKDVVPITEELGLWHPQEGIVRGHYNASKGKEINIIGQHFHHDATHNAGRVYLRCFGDDNGLGCVFFVDGLFYCGYFFDCFAAG